MAKMIPYIVRQGDHLDRLAHRFGFVADEVWADPKNDELRELRKEGSTLYPGDLIFIPAPKEQKGLRIEAGTQNSFVAEVSKVSVAMRYFDDDGPWANETYVIEGTNPVESGQTDGEGNLTLSLPVTTRTISLYFEARNFHDVLWVGHLDPLEELSGVQQRLTALGYYHGPADGDLKEETRGALCSFQAEMDLPQTGAPDDATVAALRRAYDAKSTG